MRFAHWVHFTALALTFALGSLADASASFNKVGGTLKVNGDAQNDEITIVGTQVSGTVQVFDHGQSIALVDGVHDLGIQTGDGDDFLLISGVQIGGSIKIKTGAGVDDVILRGESTQPPRDLFIGKNIDASLGRQLGDQFKIKSTTAGGVSIGGNVVVRGAAFTHFDCPSGGSNVDALDIRIGGNMRVDSGVAGDSGVQVDGTNVHGTTKITTGNKNDSVFLFRSHFVRATTIRTSGGDDFILFATGANENRFGAALVIDAGVGTDVSNAEGNGQFAGSLVLKGVESAN
jgi:hypothetical protein